ncbi:hypothetical protein LTR85_007539 [Meristemomyces frigidus]|nr:hypothetical protein LTR85_007539 [Meristemomyces frigidus]
MASDRKAAEVELGAFDEPQKELSTDDEADMRRMSKSQEFTESHEKAFNEVQRLTFSFSTTATAIANGQTGGLIIMFLVDWFGLLFVVLSLAEMSSIAPTAGGQYHWASESAPASMQKLISYMVGWLSSLAWLCGVASGIFISGLTYQGLIVINDADYVPQAYQAWLLGVMIITLGVLINTVLARWLPWLEGMIFVLFALVFLAQVVVLWVLAPRLTAGQSAIMFLIVGKQKMQRTRIQQRTKLTESSDATAHMAKETKHAAVSIPRAMIASYLVNGGLAFIMLVTYCFVLVDYDKALDSPVGLVGLPFIQVFVSATSSVGGATTLIAFTCTLQCLGLVNWMAAAARQIFAFARDRGFPFRHWITKMDAAGTYPVNSLLFVWALVVLITLIALGSTVAFDAITSLQILSLMFTYLVTLGCIIWRRLFGAPLAPGPWSLGRAGLPINIVAVLYCIYLVIFLPWPQDVPVTAQSFNWASVMFVGIMLLSALYYVAWARKVYKGPVVYVHSRGE